MSSPGSDRPGPRRAGGLVGLGGRVGGIAGGVVGVLAAGAAVGLAVERYAIGRIRAPRAGSVGQLTPPVPDRVSTVHTTDEVALHVQEDGPADAPLTAVFVHGYCLNLDSWCFQRHGLADIRNPRVRRVFYDQRSHGRSARAPSETATIDRLGEDLYELVCQVVPTGPVVLVGHSMGGMTVLALADLHPELFGDPAGGGRGPRVVGVALLATSTGRLAEVTLGLPALLARVRASLTPYLVRGMRWRASWVERGRRATGDVAFLLTRRYSFGTRDVSPWLVEYVGAMIAGTPVEVIADFLPAVTSHERQGGLAALRSVPTLVLVGDRDLLTPPAHSSAIADGLPDAELVVVPDAGHLVIMERPELVNLHLRAFLHRVARGAIPARRRNA